MARFGLIGNPLGHSVSPQIHALLGIRDYSLVPLEEDELEGFVLRGGFDGFNVTIPYKQRVIPFLTEVCGAAKEIGAVNTVVRTEKGLFGYNTDADGMKYALKKAGINLKDKNVLILGTGGTSKTAYYVAESAGAASIGKVGRTSEINYSNVYEQADAQVIINTTPVGMFPKTDATPIDPSRFPALEGLFDCVYNPEETLLVRLARERGVTCSNGLLMLIAQALRAEEYFLGRSLPEELADAVAQNFHL